MKKVFPQRKDGTVSPMYTILSGACAGATYQYFSYLVGGVAQTAAYPLDLVRRRLQVQVFQEESQKQYNGTWDAFKKIYHKEGVTGFYRGLWPNSMKIFAIILILCSGKSCTCHCLELLLL